MPALAPKDRRRIASRYRYCPIQCPKYVDNEITSLSDFLAVFHSLLAPNRVFWFRGHPQVKYKLAPSALRHDQVERIVESLNLVNDMRRFLEMKLPRPPAADDQLGWMQVAQHNGLPTRLLDWTRNAAVALFFACWTYPKKNGLVAILDPTELNQSVDPKSPRIFDMPRDGDRIKPYFKLGGRINPRGKRTIAINPTYNTERIALQQGAFTLHGSRRFELDESQASSLAYVPILKEHKQSLLNELERVGIGEMFIFPEPEHVCAHLRQAAGL